MRGALQGPPRKQRIAGRLLVGTPALAAQRRASAAPPVRSVSSPPSNSPLQVKDFAEGEAKEGGEAADERSAQQKQEAAKQAAEAAEKAVAAAPSTVVPAALKALEKPEDEKWAARLLPPSPPPRPPGAALPERGQHPAGGCLPVRPAGRSGLPETPAPGPRRCRCRCCRRCCWGAGHEPSPPPLCGGYAGLRPFAPPPRPPLP
jgi:hypothetical protein